MINYWTSFLIVDSINNYILSMEQQCYLHSQVLKTGQRKNILSLNIDNQPMICLSNDNQIELYEYAAKGITFKDRFSFFASIAHLKVLPNKHQQSDYLLVVDQRGRHAFWSVLGGFKLVQNGKSQSSEQKNLFKTNSREGEDCAFCSESHRFQVLDTRGWICFNVEHDLVIVDYTIKSTGLIVDKSRKVALEFVKFRFLMCLDHSKYKLLGFIMEKEDKTYFKVYNLDKISQHISPGNQVQTFEKTNLVEFISTNPNQALILSSNELILANVHPFSVISRFKIHQTEGRLVRLSSNLYGYIGQELILIDKTEMKSYGSLELQGRNIVQNKGVLELSFLRDLSDGGKLISIATNYNEVYFILLYENTWECCKKLASMGPIFSLNNAHHPRSLVAVTNTANKTYDVVLVEREIQPQIQKEEDIPLFPEKLFSLKQGKQILICSKQGNQLLRLNQDTLAYEPCMEWELPGEVVAVNDFFYSTSSGLYAFDEATQSLTILRNDQMMLIELKDRFAIFSNALKEVIQVDLEGKQVREVRKSSNQEYAWALLADHSLVVAESDDLSQLIRYQGDQIIQHLSIGERGIISAMAQLPQNEFLAIGFVSGTVILLNLVSSELQLFECYAFEVISFFELSSGYLGVLSGDRQFILSKGQEFTLQQVQLSYNYQPIHAIAYLNLTDQVIFSQIKSSNSILTTVNLSSILPTPGNPLPEQSYRMSTLCQFHDEIPIAYTEGTLLFVAAKGKVIVISLATRQIVKELVNYLNDVIGIERLSDSLLVYGIDQLKRNILLLIDLGTLEIISSINLILKDNKYIKQIKTLGERHRNAFVCRGEKYTTLFELSDNNEPNELSQIKVDYQGYALELDAQHRLLAMTDSYRFIAMYTYHPSITPVSRFVAASEVNDLSLLHKSVVFGDKSGEISVLEYNFQDPNGALKMLMTKVGSIKVAMEVSTLAQITPFSSLYGTLEGKVGKIGIIDESAFQKLKKVEEETFNRLAEKSSFSYSQWRNRNPSDDKLVDSRLIEHYLKSFCLNSLAEEMNQEYIQILGIYNQFCR